MHERLEQCWELKKAGKQPWHLEAEYRKIKEGKQSSEMATNTFQRGGNPQLQPKPHVDPEKLKRALERDRAAEAARKYTPHIRRGVYEFPREVYSSTFQTISNPGLAQRHPPNNQCGSAQAAGPRPASDRPSGAPGHPPSHNHWSQNGASGTSHPSNGRPSGGYFEGSRPPGAGQSGDNTSRSRSSATSHQGSRPSGAIQPGNSSAGSRPSGAGHSGRHSSGGRPGASHSATRSPRGHRWRRSKSRGRKSHSRSPRKQDGHKQPEERGQLVGQQRPWEHRDERKVGERQEGRRHSEKQPERTEGWRQDPITGRFIPVIEIKDESDSAPAPNEASDKSRTDWAAVTDRLGGQLAEVVLENQKEIMERLDRQNALLEAQQAWIKKQSLVHESIEEEDDQESSDWSHSQNPQPRRRHRRDAGTNSTAHMHYRSPTSSDDDDDVDDSDEESVVYYIRESDPDDEDYVQPSVEGSEYDSNPTPTPTPALSPTPAPAPFPRKRKARTQETSAGSSSKKRVKATPKTGSSAKNQVKETPEASSSSKKTSKAGSSSKKPVKVSPVPNPYLAQIAEYFHQQATWADRAAR